MLRTGILHDDRRRPRIDVSPPRTVLVAAVISLAGLLLTGLIVVGASAGRPSSLSPPTHSRVFPNWLAGPLHGVWSLPLTNTGLGVLFTVAIAGMYVFYVVAFLCAPRLRARWTIAAIVAAHVIFFISPPLALTDVFNYLNYGRMEIAHGLNPYATIPALEPHSDPAFALSNWHHLLSPYGPLFTFFTFALVPLGLATSFWVFKASLMLVSLASLWLVWRCAELLHRDPLKAVLLVGLNPLVLVWGLGGDHNDFFMMLFAMVAVYLLLRSKSSGFASALTLRDDLVAGRRGSRRLRASHAEQAERPRAWPGARRDGGLVPSGPTALGELLARTRRPIFAGRLVLARGWPPAAAEVVAAPQLPGSGVGSPAATVDQVAAGPLRGLRDALPVGLAVGREQALQFGCGLALVCALAIKLPAAILVPIVFAVSGHRRWLVAGMVAAGVVAALASLVAFGTHLPDLGTQSSLVTAVGLPSLLGYGLGLGGETVGLRGVLVIVLLVAVAGCALWACRRSGDWIAPAGVAVFVLLVTLSWQAPWYVLWLLPFAALTRRAHLRVAALAFGVYAIVAFVPAIDLSPPGSPLQHVQALETARLVH
ncbi:MAG TPA: hypothetical protein VG165_18270 [Solirubrobacteraceae bacterium]|nr:hypothetical protein [Solirubrobacteraceae bacterium]